MADNSVRIIRRTRADIDEMLDKYLKELNVPHSRKEPIKGSGVVLTDSLRVGTVAELMNLVPAYGNTSMPLRFKRPEPGQASSIKRPNTHGIINGSDHSSSHDPTRDVKTGSDKDVRESKQRKKMTDTSSQRPSSWNLHSDSIGDDSYKPKEDLALPSCNAGKHSNKQNYDFSQTEKCNSHSTSEPLHSACKPNAEEENMSANTDDHIDKNVHELPAKQASTSPDRGEGSMDVDSLTDILLKAKEKVFPYSRKTMLRRLKEKNKPRDEAIEGFDDKQSCLAYMVTNYIQPFIERKVNETVSFAKLIPGFQDLPMIDRVTLLRESRLLCSIMGGYAYDFDTNTLYMDDGTPLTKADLDLIFGFEEVASKRIEYARKVDSLQLTPLEGAILRACTVFAYLDKRDSDELENRAKAISIYDQLKVCLRHEVMSSNDNPALRMEQLHELVKLCKDTTDLNLELMRSHIEHNWPSTFKHSVANDIFALK